MPVTDYLPSVQQVADQIITRTKDKYGNEIGTFNANTRPMNSDVNRMIPEAAAMVELVIGSDIPEILWDEAMELVAVRTACEIELSYYSEQVETNRSPYKAMLAQYEIDLANLAKQVSVVEDSGSLVPVETSPSLMAQGAFPDPTKYPPYGLTTRW